ncbi:MFS transporter [Rhodobacteraceae bacterium]|nr:MFS transporter [Paracoccaceae bacterium]
MTTTRKKIWGWFFFDWASQPYNTLLLTFIFAPFITDLLGDGSAAQTAWGFGVGAAGIVIAICAPILGTIADKSGGRIRFVYLFSLLYMAGATGLWWAKPGDFSLIFVLGSFAIGLIGMEFATTFTNAMLPDLAPRAALGRISGSGWAFGYVGGLISLVIVLTLFQADAETGRTMIGLQPVLGLDPQTREGTRIVGPFTALWYAVFMIPFFLWVREPKKADATPVGLATRQAWPDLKQSLARIPQNRSLFAFLVSSMLYRDGLNGIYTFGGIYAAGVLDWSITQIGLFGIVTIISGALFAWAGGRADARFGPKPVIVTCVSVLVVVVLGVITIRPDAVFTIAVPQGSALPDIAFFIMGALIGAAGGALQSASRVMMVHQSDRDRITEQFGLYALCGKATAFIAPLSIGIVTHISGTQSLGITPIIVLFVFALVLLNWVNPDPSRQDTRR